LAINALVFGEKNEGSFTLPDNIANYAKEYRNLSIYGPDKAVIGGVSGEWENETNGPNVDSYWEANVLSLVDFKAFCRYLERFVGFGNKAFEISSDDNTPTGGK
jgi:hypothetical protein